MLILGLFTLFEGLFMHFNTDINNFHTDIELKGEMLMNSIFLLVQGFKVGDGLCGTVSLLLNGIVFKQINNLLI